jgi:hypothetical protein
MFFFLSFMFFLLQNWRTRGQVEQALGIVGDTSGIGRSWEKGPEDEYHVNNVYICV